LARALAAEGSAVWVTGSAAETDIAAEIRAADPANVRDLTGPDLRNAILALAASDLVISNDSGLLHVAAAIGTPSIGIFGPTSPWHWAPLNPLAGTIETRSALPCRPCHKPQCRLVHHRCMRDIPVDRLLKETERLFRESPQIADASLCE
jgi:heptosyltransferase-2